MWAKLRGEKYKQFFPVFTIGITWHWSYGLILCYAYHTLWLTVGPVGFYLIVE